MHYYPILLLSIDLLSLKELLLLGKCCNVIVADACLSIPQILGIISRLELSITYSLVLTYQFLRFVMRLTILLLRRIVPLSTELTT